MAILEGGAALPVTTGGTGPTEGRVAAVPVYVVSGGPVIGQRARRVVVVTSGPVEGGAARPVYDAGAGALYSNEAALPVYVVQGSLGTPVVPAPVNTVLPAISGALGTLSTTDGTWLNSPSSFTYQWNRNGVPIGGATANTYVIVTADIGTTLTVTVTATNAGGSTPATSAGYTPTYTQKVIALGPIGYWPMGEPSGAVSIDESGNGRNGAYTSVTLAQPGVGDGRTSASFNGTSSTNNVYTASLAGAFNGAEGSLCGWFKVSGVGVWTDATTRRAAYFFADNNNRVSIIRTTTNNQLNAFYIAGGTSKSVNFTTSSVDWMHLAITWSKSAAAGSGEVKVYLNGVQQGATLNALGTWAGALASSTVRIGSANGGEFWSGFGQHAPVFNRALSAAEVLSLATAP